MNTNIHRTLTIALCAIIGITFTSCMHLGMAGHPGDESPTQAPLEKEVTKAGFLLRGIFPPLNAGEKTKIEVFVFDASTGMPASGIIHVAGRFEYSDNGAHHTTHDHMTNEPFELLNPLVVTEEGKGKYTFFITPGKGGNCITGFRLKAVDSQGHEEELKIEASRTVGKSHSTGGGSMMGMGMTTAAMVLGIAMMGAMMTAMWLWR